MNAVFDDDQRALAEAAARLAEPGMDAARAVRSGEPTPAEPSASLFEGFNGLGLDHPDAAGGTLVDAAIVLRALGRTCTPTAWVAHQLALHTAAAAGLDVAAALTGDTRWTLQRAGRNTRDVTSATHVVVVDGDRVEILASPDVAPGGQLDLVRPSGTVAGGTSAGTATSAAPLGRARLLAAAELAGVGDGAIAAAVAHAGQRTQFGKPIGGFQGVGHQLAEAWTQVELAWSLVLYACWAASSVDGGESDTPEVAAAIDAAYGAAVDAAIFAAERAMQVHGGVGITYEGDSHLWLRRALDVSAWLGTADEAHDRVGRQLLAS